MKSLRHSAIVAALSAIATASLAHANLLTNGGFETGDFSGWTQTGNLIGTEVGSLAGETGNFCVLVGSVNKLDYLSQTFSTQIGQTYDVSFRFDGVNDADQELDVLFGSPTVLPASEGLTTYFGLTDLLTLGGPSKNEIFNLPEQSVWLTYSFSVEATSTTSQLTFASRQDPRVDVLDDVSVVLDPKGIPPGNPSAVPEPATYGWLGIAALLSVVGRRRIQTNRRSLITAESPFLCKATF